MGLYEDWKKIAYSETADKGELQRFWSGYFHLEKGIYEEILKDTKQVVKGTVKQLAEKFDVDLLPMTGFLDGINESLKTPNDLEALEEDSEVQLGYDVELLYKNMVAADADWLYGLEAWESILEEDTRKSLYKEQKLSTTIVKEDKVYPNDQCPCDSGKKYKKCCGR